MGTYTCIYMHINKYFSKFSTQIKLQGLRGNLEYYFSRLCSNTVNYRSLIPV